MFELFLTILAWVSAIFFTLFTLLRIWAKASYSEIDKLLDMQKGVVAKFPIKIPLIISIISWCWIIAKYLHA